MATLKQAKKLLQIFEDLDTAPMQDILRSGVLAVVRDRPDLIQQFINVDRGRYEIVMKKVLALVETVEIPPQDYFAVSDKFRVNMKDGAEVKIAEVWNFHHFRPMTESPVLCYAMNVWEVKVDVDSWVIKKEIGEGKEDILLSQLWFLLQKQGHGEVGVLRTDGMQNICYVIGQKEDLWTVKASWKAALKGWSINVARNYPAKAQDQVLSLA